MIPSYAPQSNYISSRGLGSHEAAPQSPEVITYTQSGETSHERVPSTVAPTVEYTEQHTQAEVQPVSIRYTSTPTNVVPLQYSTNIKQIQPVPSIQTVQHIQPVHIPQVQQYHQQQAVQYIQPQQYYQYPQYSQHYPQQQYSHAHSYPHQSLQAPIYDFYGFHNRHPTSLLDSYIPSSVLLARQQKQFQSHYYQPPSHSKPIFQPAALDALSSYNTIAYSIGADESSHAKRSSQTAAPKKPTQKNAVPVKTQKKV